MSANRGVLREAVASDAVALAVLHVKVWKHAYRNLLDHQVLEKLTWRDWYPLWRDRLLDGDGRTYIATTAGLTTGLINVGRDRWGGSTTSATEVRALYVDAAYWGRGLGSALLNHALQCVTPVPRTVRLWTPAAATQTRSFYEGHGFRCKGEERSHEALGSRIPVVLYQRDVDVS